MHLSCISREITCNILCNITSGFVLYITIIKPVKNFMIIVSMNDVKVSRSLICRNDSKSTLIPRFYFITDIYTN